MKPKHFLHRRHARAIFNLLLTCFMFCLLAASAAAEDAAIISGYTISSETPPKFPIDEDVVAQLEDGADIGLAMALYRLGIDPGSNEYDDITGAVDDFWDSARPQDREIKRESYVIMYLPCMMWMSTPANSMSIRIPPGQSSAFMEVYDSSTQQGFATELNRELSATSALTGKGWNSGISMTPESGTETLIGYETQKYSFESTGGLGSLGQSAGSVAEVQNHPAQPGLGGMSALVSVQNSGTAWVADDVEGIDIMRAFYQTFSSEVAAGQGENSLFGGMMKNMVGLLQHGMPLHIIQTTQSKVAGKTSMSGTSESWVTNADVISRDTAMCSLSTIPEGYEITHMGAQPGGEPCDCSCEAFKALQDMGKQGKGESDAASTAMAMCMSECMGAFMSCAMKMSR